jgi:hypothetical protein
MADEQLSLLAVVALEKEYVKQLDLDTAVDKYYSQHQITRIFLEQSGANKGYFLGISQKSCRMHL